jgi:hypothetical protein
MYKEIFNKLNSYYFNSTVTNSENFVYKDEVNGILSITPIYPNEYLKLTVSSDFISDVISATAKTKEVIACEFTLYYYTPKTVSPKSPSSKTFSNDESFVEIFDEISRNKIRRILVNFFKPYETVHDEYQCASYLKNEKMKSSLSKSSSKSSSIDENELPALIPADENIYTADADALSISSSSSFTSSSSTSTKIKDGFILINPSPKFKKQK